MVTDGPLTGKLLVATPTLEDPNFDRTVVLVLAHTDEGALGLVLNRPSELPVSEPLPEWAPLTLHPRVVYVGGPVQPDGVICLGLAERGAMHLDGFTELLGGLGGLGLIDLNRGPEVYASGLSGIRLFAGHAGWTAGQLEGEIEQGGWFVVDAVAGDAVTDSAEDLWRRVLRRQPPRLAMFANSPPRLSMN